MQEQRSGLSKQWSNNTALYYLPILITGFGTGWLIGLSVSPVVSIVITSVTGSAAAIIAAMSGVEKKLSDTNQSEKNEKIKTYWIVNPVPLAVLVVGLIVGSIAGILARNNNIFGSDISIEMQRWSKAGLTQAGLSEEDIILRLFDTQFPVNSQLTRSIPPGGTVLFTVSVEQCDALDAALARTEIDDPEALAKALRRFEQLKRLPDIVSDPELLKNIVREVLCPQGNGP